MRKIIRNKKVTWIDIQEPTKADINYLKKKFNFHPLILDELLHPGDLRERVEHHRNYLFMVVYYPVYKKEEKETVSRELNIIATKNTLITSHYSSILPLRIFFNACKLLRRNRKTYMSEGSGQLLYYILSAFWKNCLTKIERINNRIEKTEKDIFRGREREMVLEISLIKTDIINFWRVIEPQKEVLESLLREGVAFFGKGLSPHFSDILGIYGKVLNGLERNKETILALEDTNQSLLSTRINEIIKVLTIFSVILLPLTLIASIWGMNFPSSLPLTDSPIGFWIIFIIMILMTGSMIFYFRKKKWL